MNTHLCLLFLIENPLGQISAHPCTPRPLNIILDGKNGKKILLIKSLRRMVQFIFNFIHNQFLMKILVKLVINYFSHLVELVISYFSHLVDLVI